jgi:hypothetical protein
VTRHWVVAELSDPAALASALETLKREGVKDLSTYAPRESHLGGVALIGGALSLVLAPISFVLALIAAPATAAVAVFIGLIVLRPRAPFEPGPLHLSATTVQGDVAEKTKARLEALGAKNVTVVIEATK